MERALSYSPDFLAEKLFTADMDHSHHQEHTKACCPGTHEGHKKPWYQTGLFLISVVTAVVFVCSLFFPFLKHFRESFLDYLKIIGLPMTAGFLLGGMVEYYVPKEYISKYLAQTHKRTILYSAGLGFLMTACSHGIIALSMELHKKGASGPAVVSFLLASPWANLPITFLLIGFFGWKSILIILGALGIAITTGFIFQWLDRKGLIERNRHSVSVAQDFSIRKDMAKRLQDYRPSLRQSMRDIQGIIRGMIGLMEMVLGWVLFGILLASFVSAFVPEHVFHRFFGPTLFGLLITLLAATVIEVCSEGTAPLAFEIYKQTGALGNAFAFLMGGVATDYMEIGLVWKNLGKKTALWMLAVSIPQVLVLGWAFNTFLS